MAILDLDSIEALCAAAHDCDPSGRRPVGLPAPVVRELTARARRLAEIEAKLLPKSAAHRKALRAAQACDPNGKVCASCVSDLSEAEAQVLGTVLEVFPAAKEG